MSNDNLTPAQELRAAASKIRDTARNATPGPWTVGGQGEVDEIDHYERPILAEVESRDEDDKPFKEIVQVAAVTYHTNGFQYPHAEAKAEAEHIALWHPGVAVLIADWLETVAEVDEHGFRPASSSALAVAHAINGGA